jgi:hypothetical protein
MPDPAAAPAPTINGRAAGRGLAGVPRPLPRPHGDRLGPHAPSSSRPRRGRGARHLPCARPRVKLERELERDAGADAPAGRAHVLHHRHAARLPAQ